MTLLEAVRGALSEALREPSVVLLGQLVKYGLGGMTTGLHDEHPAQVITFPVSENLMHGAAMGLALGGLRPIVINERMDFLALAMDPLVNHIPVWPLRHPKARLPLVVIAVVGKGKGQGPQHSKNLAPWFRGLEGWHVAEPNSPEQAWIQLVGAMRDDKPVMYVLHREHFNLTGEFRPPTPAGVGLCGASARHEANFYSRGDDAAQ